MYSTDSDIMMPHTSHISHTRHTPHTPGGGSSGPPSVPSKYIQKSTGNLNTSDDRNTNMTNDTTDMSSDLNLNFDPAMIIDGEDIDQGALNLLSDNVVDPMELLSYPDSPDLNTPPNNGASPLSSDDILRF